MRTLADIDRASLDDAQSVYACTARAQLLTAKRLAAVCDLMHLEPLTDAGNVKSKPQLIRLIVGDMWDSVG
jgi:hypothetical protein